VRLAIFSPYFPPHVGGVEHYVEELNEVLLRTGAVEAITVLAPRLPPSAAARERHGDAYRVLRYPAFEPIPNLPVPRFWSPALWRTVREALAPRPDLLVGHTRFFPSSALALLCARRTRTPLLHIEHGSGFMHLGGPLATAAGRAYDLTVGRWLLRGASGVAAVSRAGAEFVRRLSGRSARVIHRGIWPERLAGTEPDAAVIAKARGRPIVSFAGRLIHSKGVADLVQAFAATQAPESVLCLVGDGPCQADLERLAQRLGVADRVLFLGYVDPGRALAVLSASDVVANPSYTEGLPTAVLEAAGLGRAVLATDVGGTSEIVADGESAVLVPPRDVPALSRRLGELLADVGLRERLGAAAAARAQREFNWDTSAALFVKLARTLADTDRTSKPYAADQRTTGARTTSSNTDS